MAGTLCLLGQAGWEPHYFNVSTGNLGSHRMTPVQTARVRRDEAQDSCRVMGAAWHAPVCDDLQIFYDDRTLRRICAVIREVAPAVILTHSPDDYMEDHMNTSRLTVTAAFARGTPGYRTVPSRKPVAGPVVIYHAMPHGLRDGLRRPVRPDAFVDTTTVQAQKRAALARHESQRAFLKSTQGMSDCIRWMDATSRQLGRMSRRFRHAEGWRRHSHLGFCPEGANPLREVLGRRYYGVRSREL